MDMQIEQSAADKLAGLMPNENSRLRVFVKGGGCSGMEYGMVFDDKVHEPDHLHIDNGIGLVVDAMSYEFIKGSTIYLEEDLMGSNFRIDNPNAVSSCGCGSSFRCN